LIRSVLLGTGVKGGKVELDLQELITGRTLLCSVSGGGKSWTGRRIVEQIFGQTGIVIIDVEGEYATLRERYPFLIVGKDVQLVPEAAEFLADQVLQHDLSVILDGSDPNLDIAAFQEFLARFIDRFIALETTQRKPYLWFAEEADELAPETGIGRSLCLSALRKLVKKGRKRGLGIVVMTQRPAFVTKFVISQCTNKLVGKTEWPDDIAVLQKFARIPKGTTEKLGELEKGQFYAAGDFIKKPCVVKVGTVITKHSGATPELIPPAPKELESVVAQLSENLPRIIQEQLVPAVPKVAEIEARLKEKVEAQWQVRLARKDKELASIKNRTEAKYETEIADLKRKLDEAVRHATLKGGVSDLLQHPLVQKNLSKLNEKQEAFVKLLETKGPQDPEHCSLFLETKPKNVPTFVYDINRKIPKLIENQGGRYVSRLAKLFPVTEEAQAEAKESERLRQELEGFKEALANRDAIEKDMAAHADRKSRILETEIAVLKQKLMDVEGQLQAKVSPAASTIVPGGEGSLTPKVTCGPAAPASSKLPEIPEPPTPQPREIIQPNEVKVEATLHRTLTKFDVTTSVEVLDADDSTPIGRLLATGLRGFFSTPRTFGEVMAELFRKYSTNPDSGGSKDSVRESLAQLVAKDILDRDGDAKHGWNYFATPRFAERVRPLQETTVA
jgi:hypothetical protein